MQDFSLQYKGYNSTKKTSRNNAEGFTLIEILIVVLILGVLLTMSAHYLMRHLARARDAERKGDLEKIREAFEDYYNDNSCYPPIGSLEDCGSYALKPYLNEIPCDPKSKKPYPYLALRGNECAGYKIVTNLEYDEDPMIERAGCSYAAGCDYTDDDGEVYDYGIVAGDVMMSAGWSETGGAYGHQSFFYLTYEDDDGYMCSNFDYYTAAEQFCCYSSCLDVSHCNELVHDCQDGDGCSEEALGYVCDLDNPCE